MESEFMPGRCCELCSADFPAAGPRQAASSLPAASDFMIVGQTQAFSCSIPAVLYPFKRPK